MNLDILFGRQIAGTGVSYNYRAGLGFKSGSVPCRYTAAYQQLAAARFKRHVRCAADLGLYRHGARTGLHGHITLRRGDGSVYIDCAVAGIDLDILFGCYIAFPVIADRHSARTGLHGHSALLRLYGLAYYNIAILGAHGQILLHRQVIAKGDVALCFRLRIERALGRHIIRHQKIAVCDNQMHIVSGFQFSFILKSDVFAVRDIVLPCRFDRNVRCGSLALD